MKVINLLPESELKELRLQLSSQQLLRFFVTIFITLVAFFLLSLAVRFYIEGSIAQTKTEVTQLQEQLSSSNNKALEKQVLALNTQIKNIRQVKEQKYYWSKALIELGNITPLGVHMNNMSFDRASGKIVVDGYADKREDVISFWSNVRKSSLFANINFPLNNLEKATNTPFTYTFLIKPEAIRTQ